MTVRFIFQLHGLFVLAAFGGSVFFLDGYRFFFFFWPGRGGLCGNSGMSECHLFSSWLSLLLAVAFVDFQLEESQHFSKGRDDVLNLSRLPV